MEGEFTKVATSPQVAKYMGFAKTAARRDMASRNAAFAREKSVLLLLRELVRLTRDGALPAPVPAPAA